MKKITELSGDMKFPELKKLFRIMKLTTFLILISVVCVFASETYSQSKKLNLNMKNATVKEVLSAIEDQSEFKFMYSGKVIDVNREVAMNEENAKIEDALKSLFAGTDVDFTIENRIIVLSSTSLTNNELTSTQQQKSISGKVTDSTGASLPGVSIAVKGTTTGTVSDIDGNYTLNIPTNAITLVFSFVGMKTQEIEIGSKTKINVTLVDESIGLDEVVAIGYGKVKKSDVTGSVSSLSENNLSTGMVVAPQQAMQGKISGVNISLNSGEPGANSSVRIRGGTSINASNNPLYVIDGVPVAFDEGSYTTASSRQTRTANNPLAMINAADIKSIDILKDASATAIYGSRGANGVIIVTTKQGIVGRSKISYETFMEVSKIRKKIDVLSGEEFRSYITSHPEIKNWKDGGTVTDWQDQIFRTAFSHSHNLAFSAGDKSTTYRASLNYSNQEGIILNSALQRITARININHSALNDKLTMKLFFSGAMLNNNSAPIPESAGNQYDGGIIRDALIQDPTYPVKDDKGIYSWHGILNPNPVEQANTLIDKTETFRNLGNLALDYKITKSLTFNTNVGFTKEYVDRYYYAPASSRMGSSSQGMASHLGRNNYSKLLETNLYYSKVFKEKHDLNTILGYSYQDFFYTGFYNYATKFISDVTTYNNLGAGLNQYPSSSYKNSNRLISFYGRASYSYDNKYLLTVTVRKDGSSRFGANYKWGIFPSMAFAWKLTEEKFLKNNKLISNLKLRAGYGVTGNQAIGSYLSLPTLSAGGNIYIIGGTAYTAVGANQYDNPDLKWESTAQLNFGLDFGVLNDRLSGSIDFYNKTTKDLLLSFAVPSPAQINTTIANVGSVNNKGVEFEIKGFILTKGSIKWEAFGNLSHNLQKVTSLSNDTWKTSQIYTRGFSAPGFSGFTMQIIKPGEPLGTYYGYQYIGVNENGIQQFKDLNGDGKILPGDDRMVLGSSQPNLFYGFGSKLSYKAFTLDFLFRGISGIKVMNSTAIDIQNITRLPAYNISNAALSDGIAYGQTMVFSSKWIQDASFLRLENISLGYNVKLKSTNIFSKIYPYISGQNLFVLTNYNGFDPEVSNGEDYMTYPRPRVLIVGISLEF